MLVIQISIGMSIIVGIWVFVGMINFMLGQVEHEIGRFCLKSRVLYIVLWEASSVLLLVYALFGLYIHFAVVN